jgi:hypothetical protein
MVQKKGEKTSTRRLAVLDRDLAWEYGHSEKIYRRSVSTIAARQILKAFPATDDGKHRIEPKLTMLSSRAACLLVMFAFPTVGLNSRAPAQDVNPTSAATNVTAPTGVYVQTHIDPLSGRTIDTYLEYTSVPVARWVNEEKVERRYVPEWVSEVQKTTEAKWNPVTQYQPRQINVNAWNPLLPPRMAWEYVPITQYQSQNVVVERPVTYQKYVDKEVKVVVPKLVQMTEQRAQFVQRERSLTPMANTNGNVVNTVSAPGIVAPITTAPMYGTANWGMANRAWPQWNYVTRPSYAMNQPPNYYQPNYYQASPAWQTQPIAQTNSFWGQNSWLASTQPLFRGSLFRQNPASMNGIPNGYNYYGAPPGSTTPLAPFNNPNYMNYSLAAQTSPTPQVPYMNAIGTSQSMTQATIRPQGQTNPYTFQPSFGSGAMNRDAMQQGNPATVLR